MATIASSRSGIASADLEASDARLTLSPSVVGGVELRDATFDGDSVGAAEKLASGLRLANSAMMTVSAISNHYLLQRNTTRPRKPHLLFPPFFLTYLQRLSPSPSS